MKVSRLAYGVMSLVLTLILSPALPGQEPKLEQIHVLTLVGRPLAIAVGESRGTFAKYGIEVHTENLPNSDVMRAALAAGKGDLAYAAVDNAVAMVELAGADVAIVSGGEGSLNELITQPDVKSIKDLRGKTLLVDAVNTAYALQLKKILLMDGMQPGRDYEMNAYGGTPLRLAALLKQKEFAGSMLPPPSSITARRAGLVSLGSVADLLGPYQAAGHFGLRKWEQEHKSSVVRYLAAYVEAQRWMMDAANKQRVIELMTKEYHLAPDVAAENYELSMTHQGGFEKDVKLDPQGFENVLKLRAEVEGQWGGHPPPAEKYYDSTYYQAARDKVHGMH
jgi:ABC-type nitrate/sulfonate/bicarbonate transport system substrate-binding protein